MDIILLSELAPTGVIRAAVNLSNSALVCKDDMTGQCSGVSVELARRLGEKVQTPVSIVQYKTAADVVSAVHSDEWDIAFIASDPSRTEQFSFSPAYAHVEATFIVARSSRLFTIADIDDSAVTVASAKGAAYTKLLERQLKSALVQLVDNPSAAYDMLKAGLCDAAAGLSSSLSKLSKSESMYRLIPGSFSRVPQAIAVRKEHRVAASFVEGFLREAMAEAEMSGEK